MPSSPAVKMICYANKTHFHKKGFVLSLFVKVKVFGTKKWPFAKFLIQCFFSFFYDLKMFLDFFQTRFDWVVFGIESV